MAEPLFEEEATAFERELLRAGTSYRVPAESRARTLAALGLGATVGTVAVGTAAAGASVAGAGVTGSTATGATVAGTSVAGASAAGAAAAGTTMATQVGGGAALSGASLSLFAKLSGAKFGLAVAALGAASSVPVYFAFRSEPEPVAPSGQSVVALAQQRSAEVTAVVESTPAAQAMEASEAAPPSIAPEKRAGGQKPKADAKPGSIEKGSAEKEALRAEVGSLDRVRSKLSSGNAAGALALLDEYNRSFPRGLLSLEAEVLRIDALAKSGQPDAARMRARAFLRQHPKGVLASRVRRYAEP